MLKEHSIAQLPIGTCPTDDLSIIVEETDMMSEIVKIGVKKLNEVRVKVTKQQPSVSSSRRVIDKKERRKLEAEDVSKRWRVYGSPVLPHQIRDKEVKWMLRRRIHLLRSEDKPRKIVEESKIPTVGMCFSGGGVRSAAFQTGVMKALSHFKNRHFDPNSPKSWLSFVDYLSCVSGGGYCGSAYVLSFFIYFSFQAHTYIFTHTHIIDT